MLGLAPRRLRAYLRAGLLSAERNENGRLQFSFRDLLLLRTAEGLVAERIPPRRVLRALRKLRERVPDARPLTELQLGADGDRVVVRDGVSRWHAESGQVLLAFPDDAPPVADSPVSAFPPRGATQARSDTMTATTTPDASTVPVPDTVELSPDELHRIGCTLEETDARGA